jgi:hypothetical protein
VLYVPAAVTTVLLPKISSRAHANRQVDSIFGASLVTTSGFCVLGTLAYATVPSLILSPLLGRAFSGGSDLLWMFGIAMTGYAILNVMLVYHLGLGSNGFAMVLLSGALLQLAAYAVFHGSAHEILWVSMATAIILVAVHELVYTHAGATRAALTALRQRGRAKAATV